MSTGFGLASIKQEGGSGCTICSATAGPGEPLEHAEWCTWDAPKPPKWRITGTFRISMEVYANTPSEAIADLSHHLADHFEYERVDQINITQIDKVDG